MANEEKRQIVHILLFLFAFFLKYLGRFQVAFLLTIIFLVVALVIPRLKIKSHFYRPTESYYSQGALFYFLVLLILVLFFPAAVVAASWAILALGDGMATLIGQNFKVRELPWNKEKTYYGSFAFIIFATLGAFILLKWMLPEIGSGAALAAGLKTSVVAGVVESLPLKINDNITVAVASALVLSFLI